MCQSAASKCPPARLSGPVVSGRPSPRGWSLLLEAFWWPAGVSRVSLLWMDGPYQHLSCAQKPRDPALHMGTGRTPTHILCLAPADRRRVWSWWGCPQVLKRTGLIGDGASRGPGLGQLWPEGLGPNAHGFELRAAGSQVKIGGSRGHLPLGRSSARAGQGLPWALGDQRRDQKGPGQPGPQALSSTGRQKGWGTAGAGLPAAVSATAGGAHPGAGVPHGHGEPRPPESQVCCNVEAVTGQTPHQPARHPWLPGKTGPDTPTSSPATPGSLERRDRTRPPARPPPLAPWKDGTRHAHQPARHPWLPGKTGPRFS